MRREFYIVSTVVVGLVLLWGHFVPFAYYAFAFVGPLILIGLRDVFQSRRTILRNFPILGHGRYLMEMIRPEINQYFIESDINGRPFSREMRSVVYQRAKSVRDTIPFGTQNNVYEVGYEWINHSMLPKRAPKEAPRVAIGAKTCEKPYNASVLNIGGMSYGALSAPAILSLNGGAKVGGFAHNTGEGGLSRYHTDPGGDVIWQIGTGYFGCRDEGGRFAPEKFKERALHSSVKMIELKLSQGAKPGHGGILPAAKVSQEISQIRGVPLGMDVISPPAHREFSTPIELLHFLQKLRELSGGKPVGIKLCVGKRREFFSLCKAIIKEKLSPDFIAIDGSEGGTGAAPLEFADSIGTPLNDGLIFVHNALVGSGLRDQIKIIASGKVMTGFNIATRIALGADLCYSARGMMFALGCIQALRCNANTCPTGIATTDSQLAAGIHVGDKTQRVANYHRHTVESFLEVIAAAGIEHPDDLEPWLIRRRVNAVETKHYGQIYDYLEPGCLLSSASIPASYQFAWEASRADTFEI